MSAHGASSVVIVTCVLGACVGEAPIVSPSSSDGGGVDAAASDGGGSDATTGDASTAADAGPPPGAKRVFVTTDVFKGDFGGPSAGDGKCVSAATTANLGGGGQWRAWLSASAGPEAGHAVDRVTGNGPWYLVDGTLAVADRVQLTATNPVAAIRKDASGRPVPDTDEVWTGTKSGDTAAVSDCVNWTDGTTARSGKSGRVGSVGAAWTSNDDPDCSHPQHLYCFEL